MFFVVSLRWEDHLKYESFWSFYSLCMNSFVLNWIWSSICFHLIADHICGFKCAVMIIMGNGRTGEALFNFIPDSLYSLLSICSSVLKWFYWWIDWKSRALLKCKPMSLIIHLNCNDWIVFCISASIFMLPPPPNIDWLMGRSSGNNVLNFKPVIPCG